MKELKKELKPFFRLRAKCVVNWEIDAEEPPDNLPPKEVEIVVSANELFGRNIVQVKDKARNRWEMDVNAFDKSLSKTIIKYSIWVGFCYKGFEYTFETE